MKQAKTRRGAETKDRILTTAAELIHERGVTGSSIDDILAASGTGKSQFYLYFESKDALLREVLGHNLAVVLSAQEALLERLSTWRGIKAWLDALADMHESRGLFGGCRIGSLAAEMTERDEELRLAIAEAFSRWESFLAAGLETMRDRGALLPGADPQALAETTMASIQGGYLLSTTKKDIRPMRNALAAAYSYLRSFRASSEAKDRS
ncbi:MAG TPA: TetR/AcrR family transcriptional regulator [Acidimicrobiales bacterium]|nr:TetR/AcrR family transcriptional regulator [Acidimicrobiales bacterium]